MSFNFEHTSSSNKHSQKGEQNQGKRKEKESYYLAVFEYL